MGRESVPEQQRNMKWRAGRAGLAAAAAAEVENAMAPVLDRDAAAFFDVDDTIMQGASIFHLARGLHRRKFFTTGAIAKAAWQQFYCRFAGVERPDHLAKARPSGVAFIAGHTGQGRGEMGVASVAAESATKS